MHRRTGEVGYSTNGYKVIDYLIKENIPVDKVMIFTDCQMWDSKGYRSYCTVDGHISRSWHKYKAMYPDARLYLFDLSGYGNTPVNLVEKDVFLIAGWSEKIFDVLDSIEKGGDTLDLIKSLEI